ncbi:MAG: hypothetical protein V1495_04115 [Pseudomonadota bacterium]
MTKRFPWLVIVLLSLTFPALGQNFSEAQRDSIKKAKRADFEKMLAEQKKIEEKFSKKAHKYYDDRYTVRVTASVVRNIPRDDQPFYNIYVDTGVVCSTEVPPAARPKKDLVRLTPHKMVPTADTPGVKTEGDARFGFADLDLSLDHQIEIKLSEGDVRNSTGTDIMYPPNYAQQLIKKFYPKCVKKFTGAKGLVPKFAIFVRVERLDSKWSNITYFLKAVPNATEWNHYTSDFIQLDEDEPPVEVKFSIEYLGENLKN